MRSKWAWSIPIVIVGLLSWNASLAQEKKKEEPKKEEHKKVEPPKKEEAKAKNIVEIAKAAPNMKSFAKAVAAAGLEKELEGAGPFTVFAPNDEAFKKWADFDNMLKPENKDKLRKTLMGLIVKGKHVAADVKKMKEAETLGGKVAIAEKDGTLMFGTAKVVKADVAAGNGVIHEIDAVIAPAAGKEEPKKEEPKKPGGGG